MSEEYTEEGEKDYSDKDMQIVTQLAYMNFSEDDYGKTIGQIMDNQSDYNDLYDAFMDKYDGDDSDSGKSRKAAAEEFFTELSTNEKYRDWKIVDVNDKNDGGVGDFRRKGWLLCGDNRNWTK